MWFIVRKISTESQWRDNLLKISLFLFYLSISCAYTQAVLADSSAYEILGISKSASIVEIKKAYREKAMELHRMELSEEKAKAAFQELNQARDILVNQNSREFYDQEQQYKNETFEERLERKHREGTLNYFEAEAYSRMKWDKRKRGSSYEDAKAAFALNSYSASENLKDYDLTQDQMFELGQIAAKETGAVFTNLVKYYPLVDPSQRFELALIAAKANSWANIEFDIEAFQLEDSSLRFQIAKEALARSPYQARFIGKWGFDKRQIYELLKMDAKGGPEVVERMNLIPLTQKQRAYLLRLAGLYGGFDQVAEVLQDFGLKDSKLFFEVLKYWAAHSRYFGDSVQKFGITDRHQLNELAQINFSLKKTAAMRFAGPEHFNLTDDRLWTVYFQNRDLSDTDPLYDLLRNRGVFVPIKLNQKWSDYHIKLVPRLWKQYHKIAKEHPKLLSTDWLRIVQQSKFLDPDIQFELLRKAYFLSTTEAAYVPRDTWDLLCTSSGLQCPRNLKNILQSNEAINEFFRALLTLNQSLSVPAFDGIEVSQEFFTQENIPNFVKIISAFGLKVKGRDDGERGSNSNWKQLVRRFRLKENGLHPADVPKILSRLNPRSTCTEILVP